MNTYMFDVPLHAISIVVATSICLTKIISNYQDQKIITASSARPTSAAQMILDNNL